MARPKSQLFASNILSNSRLHMSFSSHVTKDRWSWHLHTGPCRFVDPRQTQKSHKTMDWLERSYMHLVSQRERARYLGSIWPPNLHHKSNSMENTYCSHRNSNHLIVTIFHMSHQPMLSWPVYIFVGYVSKECNKSETNFHRIWKTVETWLIKWASGGVSLHFQNSRNGFLWYLIFVSEKKHNNYHPMI